MAAAAGFDDVLRAMGSTDNTIRAAAEAQYNAMKEEAVDMVSAAPRVAPLASGRTYRKAQSG